MTNLVNFNASSGKSETWNLMCLMDQSKGIERIGGDFTPNREGLLLPRPFDNSLSVYHFLKFEPQLGKSEKFNNQGMKEHNFRIPFIT